MTDIILIEDDAQIAMHLKHGLAKENFQVNHFYKGAEAVRFLESNLQSRLIILDLMLPDTDGLKLLSDLRSRGNRIPVLILSAKSSVDDRVIGLKTGADDYLVKPFSFLELMARIEVILRRQEQVKPAIINIDKIEIDPLQRVVRREGVVIELHSKEYLLLELLIRNANKVIPKKMIIEEVYGTSLKAQSNLVDVLVFRLRSKFDKPFSKQYIQTIHGLGFSFESH